jgi:LacI family transcriptional regulator, kdg operon repressor
MEKVTIADVAREAGVSKSTVSQFLNKRYEYMGNETRKKIEEAIERLDYQPNFIARSLKQKRTSTIGIIVANIMHRFSTEVSRAIEDYCHTHDMHAIVCNADDNPDKEKKYIEMLMAKQVDGLIIFPTGQNVNLYRNMVKAGYPVVFMDRKVEKLMAPTIVVNNREATYEAVTQLIQNGHHQIAMIIQPLTISTRLERIEGYKRALEDNDIPVNPDYIISTEIKLMNEELERLFSLGHPPTAVFAGNDLVCFEVLKFVKERNMIIPDELSLIVFDNVPFAHISNPTITTIRQPAFEMGEKAAELLLKLVKKDQVPPTDYVYPCELIIRQSLKMNRS